MNFYLDVDGVESFNAALARGGCEIVCVSDAWGCENVCGSDAWGFISVCNIGI